MIQNLFLIFVLAMSGSIFALEAIPGEYIVKLRRGVSAKSALSSPAVKRVYSRAKKLKSTRGNFLKVKMRRNVSRASAFNAFKMDRRVEYVEPNYKIPMPKYAVNKKYKATNIPGDASFSKLWGLNNKANGFDIGALESWKITKGSRKVVVAVIDTGIDYRHPDLKGNMWINRGEIAGNGIDDDNNGYVDDIFGLDPIENDSDPMDINSHGTHCAGTIGAVHNSIGVAGVAANVQLMAVRIFGDDDYTSTAAITEAIYYAVDNGAHVLSNSWGGGPPSKAIQDAIKYANAKNVVFVAAAGNDYKNNDTVRQNYPSGYDTDNIVAVAAHDINGKKANFSNYGKISVDVAAPGVDILSTIPMGGYASYSGTSMATPHVSGVVAMMLSLNANYWINKPGVWKSSKVNPKSIRDLLIKTSQKHGDLEKYTVSGGFVRMDRLLKAVISQSRR